MLSIDMDTTFGQHPCINRRAGTFTTWVYSQSLSPITMFGNFFEHGMELGLPRRGIKRGDETISAIVPLYGAGNEAGHIQSCVTQHIKQIGQYTRTCDQRNECDDGFKIVGIIAVRAGIEILNHISRSNDKEFRAGSLEILHMFGKGIQVVQLTTDAGTERHLAGLQIAAGSGIGR